MTRYPLRFLVALVAILGLVAAACGDDGDAADGGSDGASQTDGSGDDGSGDGDDGDGGAPVDDGTGADDATADDADDGGGSGDDAGTDDGDPVTLTASARGITEETIRIGLAIPDLSAFSNGGDIVARYRVAGEAVNEAGGVIGRQLEFVVEEWDSVDSAGLDAACIALTEDTEVFAIITRMPAALGDAGCFSGLGATITVSGTGVSSSAWVASEGRHFATNADPYASIIGAAEQIAAEIPGAKVALSGGNDPIDQERIGDVADALEAAGLDVVATTFATVSYSDDSTASLAEQDTFSQVWMSEGATHVLGVGTAATGIAEAIENNALHDDLTLITGTTGLRTIGGLGTDLSALSMIGVAAEDQFVVGEDGRYGTDVCLQRIEDELDEVIDYDIEPGEVNNLPSALQACAAFDFLTAVLEAAGPNPTQADFLAVVEGGLDFEMTGAASARADTSSAYLNRAAGLIFDWDGTEFTARG